MFGARRRSYILYSFIVFAPLLGFFSFFDDIPVNPFLPEVPLIIHSAKEYPVPYAGGGSILGCSLSGDKPPFYLQNLPAPPLDMGCGAYGVVIQNYFTHALDSSDYSPLVGRVINCLQSRGYPNIQRFGLPMGSDAINDLMECKEESMFVIHGIYENIDWHPGPGGASPFLNACPVIGSYVTLLVQPSLGNNGVNHVVTCQVIACDPATGEADLDCFEAPTQSGGNGGNGAGAGGSSGGGNNGLGNYDYRIYVGRRGYIDMTIPAPGAPSGIGSGLEGSFIEGYIQ